MVDIEKLILGVFERQELWNQTNKDYHNRDMARKMWISLAKEMGENSDVLKSKWRELRDNCRKELHRSKNKKGRSGDAGGISIPSKWPYFTLMLFLKDNMIQRNATGNIPPLNKQENLYDENTTPYSISEPDYDRNHNSEFNSDPELNTDTMTTTPKAAKIAQANKETGTKSKKAKSSVGI
ncbi:uncharacterized protein LOC126893249 [Diabrotica virgifera virgifera]|uniref:MADF domain-containing protein n=1 Tax=Diabrotica virgifera virgifera TaxID=50390 RepID=A0ABM5L9T7_DIAVI|nr:uncharacterized protein LOC126893249 [Diabrotica virgifera virgifera]